MGAGADAQRVQPTPSSVLPGRARSARALRRYASSCQAAGRAPGNARLITPLRGGQSPGSQTSTLTRESSGARHALSCTPHGASGEASSVSPGILRSFSLATRQGLYILDG